MIILFSWPQPYDDQPFMAFLTSNIELFGSVIEIARMYHWDFPGVSQWLRIYLARQETRVQPLGGELRFPHATEQLSLPATTEASHMLQLRPNTAK